MLAEIAAARDDRAEAREAAKEARVEAEMDRAAVREAAKEAREAAKEAREAAENDRAAAREAAEKDRAAAREAAKDLAAQLALISSALVPALQAARLTKSARGMAPSMTPPQGGGGGGGGGSGSPGSVSRDTGSPRRSPLSDSPLLAAFAAATPPLVPLEAIAAGADSRALLLATQKRLYAHRLHTVWNLSEFDCAECSGGSHAVLPTLGRGLSLFVVVCAAHEVVAAAHALRAGVTKKHNGCSMRRLDELPKQLVATFDRVLHAEAGGAPIVWHVTLTPRERMANTAFQAAFEGWPALPCSLQAAADVPPAGAAPSEGGCSAEELRFLNPRSLGYVAQKLAAAAEQQGEGRLRAVGGSPGSVDGVQAAL